MIYSRNFFDLQFSFAETVRDLSDKSLEVALFEYTNFYVRFGFGRDFDAGHEGWQRYLAGLRKAEDGREWTYEFYLRDPEAKTAPVVAATCGCFSYALRDGGFVRLHFQNADGDDGSPLGTARIGRRRAELAALFAHLKHRVSPETPIVGASWLCNLRAYRRLFPDAYVSSARPLEGAFQSMPLWGQFVDRRGEVRPPMAAAFREALSETSNLGDVGRCFPLQALAVRAPARVFYEFFEV
jgi:hypothetical protein